MALFGRDYDRDFGYRGRSYGGSWNEHNDRDWGDRMRAGWNQMKENVRDSFGGGYDRDYGYRGGERWGGTGSHGMGHGHTMGRPMGRNPEEERGYQRGMWGGGTYDREYGRQTFEPDFNHRGTRHGSGMFGTDAGYNRSTWNAGSWRPGEDDRSMMHNREGGWGSAGYDRNPMGGREGTWMRGTGNNPEYGHGYDRGWF